MATNIVKISQSKVINSLDTYNHTALQNGMYMVSLQLTEQPPSGCIIDIQQNSVSKAITSVPAAAQGQVSLQKVLNCAINDVISIVVSSAVTADSKINSIKGILNIHPGSV